MLTLQRVRETSAVSEAYARKLLHSLAKAGAATKVAKGVYVLAPADAVEQGRPPVVDPWSVLDDVLKLLVPDYFVAYASAAYLHGAATEVPFNIQVAVPRQRRPAQIGSTRILFHRVAQQDWFGTQRVRQSGEFVTASDPERTLLDCAARPDLCGGADGLAQIAWELAWKVDAKIVSRYTKRLRNRGAVNRLGFIVQRLRRHKAPQRVVTLLRVLEKNKGGGSYALDPTLRRHERPMDPRWRIIVNADVEAWRRA